MGLLCCFDPSYPESSSYVSGKGRSDQGAISFGYTLIHGKANHPMEDYHVAEFMRIQDKEVGLFGIFDGHLGHDVPAYLQNNLFSNILNEEEFWFDPKRSILKAYVKTDEAILTDSSGMARGGSTAVTAIVIDGKWLWLAHLGDSRAVLSRGGEAIQVTLDHEPGKERKSIESKGGFVTKMPGDVPRVNGQLAVSRAFGDKSVKSHLISDPDVCSIDIDANTDILILASDGLWKVMSNKDAINIARRNKDPKKAAKILATEALNRHSKDDISCIVVRFGR